MHPTLARVRPGGGRKVVGAEPAKKMLVKPRNAGLKEGLETAAVGGAALKVAGKGSWAERSPRS
jgi:hypothetical protein